MEKEKLKEPYLDAKIEIPHIPRGDVISTSGLFDDEWGSSSSSKGWT